MSVTEVATVPEVEARDEMPVFKIDQGALALRKKERDMAKEMDKIREDITLVFGQASAIFEASKYQFVEELPEEIGRLVCGGHVGTCTCTKGRSGRAGWSGVGTRDMEEGCSG